MYITQLSGTLWTKQDSYSNYDITLNTESLGWETRYIVDGQN